MPQRQVILEFPDMAHLKAFYRSPEYQELVAVRQAAARGHLVAIEDSLGGINSARFAGYSVVAVEHSYPADKLTQAHVIIHTVKDLEGLVF